MTDLCIAEVNWFISKLESRSDLKLPSHRSNGDKNIDYAVAKMHEEKFVAMLNKSYKQFGWEFISIKDYAKQVGDYYDNRYDCQNGDIVAITPSGEILKFDLKQADASKDAIINDWLCTITNSSYDHFCTDPTNKFYIVTNYDASKIRIISALTFKKFINNGKLKPTPSVRYKYGKFIKGIDIEDQIKSLRNNHL